MSLPSDLSTIQHYDDHADEYLRSTSRINMESLHAPFLDLMPKGGKILDAGCGSGRDTKVFLDRGYVVMAIDASARMVKAANELTRQTATQLRFQELDLSEEFDGIWACASLLHVSLSEFDDVLARFATSLRCGGIFYMSFKEGRGQRTDGDRLFTDFTENVLRERLRRQVSLEIVQTWMTTDLRPGRSERWVNALVKKTNTR